ncbi:MAG: ATP-binding protein, partial [Candidatus Omnitrophota bacterium]
MKYKLFISANQKELKEERFAIKDVITGNATLRGFFDAFLFEDLPAKGKSAVTTYLKNVTNSDVYVCIIGNTYGDKGKDGLCPTEREFRHFLKTKSKAEILAFIKGNSTCDKRRDKDTQNFVKDIKASFIYKRFRNVDDLKTQVLNSLISFLDDKGEFSKGPFDKTVRKDLGYETIDEKAVKDFLRRRAEELDVEIPKITVKNFLTNTLKVVKKDNGDLHPTNAALLFFGKDPSEHISHHEIRIARFRGTTRSEFIDSQEIQGSIYKMLDEVEIFFKRNTRLANKIVEFKRVDIPEYPYEAIREAIINAVSQRDYKRRGAPIMIAIFDDRVEVRNPGGLLPGLNIKKLEGNHQTRNEVICRIFHETLDMEKFGTGIGKMKRLMKEHGLSAPQFSEEGDVFVVKFYGPGDKILDLVPSIPANRMTDLSHLNKRQLEALKLIYNKGNVISRKDYAQRFNTSIRSAQRDLCQLLTEHLITQEGAGRAV